MHALTRRALVALAAPALILTAWPAQPARAASISVTTTADELNSDGDCSLREAIRAANTDLPVDGCAAGSGSDTITLPAGTYRLQVAGTGDDATLTGDLDITEGLTINGAGKADTIIDAAGIDRVLDVRADALIRDLTITGGDLPADSGGGIQVGGSTLSLLQARVTGNSAVSGGGVLVSGSGTLVAVETRISGNSASSSGGGAFVYGELVLRASLVDGNTAEGFGGGVFSQGDLSAENSTISGNSVVSPTGLATRGGGLSLSGPSWLYNVTVAENQADFGGGVYVGSVGAVTMANSLIGDNSGASSPDCSGTIASEGNNLIESLVSCTVAGSTASNLTGVDPALGPLQGNGGPTLTHALQAGSPAVNAGRSAGCLGVGGALVDLDQRGFVRADRCDIGAFERGSPGAPTRAPTATPTRTSTPTATATRTSTPTATRTSTPTATRTSTPTATSSGTATRTSSPTSTRPPVDGATPTPTPSRSPTATGSPAPGATARPDEPPPTPLPGETELEDIYLPIIGR